MTIKKFVGKTQEEAVENAKQELGTDAVIMNVRLIKQNGFAGLFGKVSYEVTAAAEEKTGAEQNFKTVSQPQPVHEKINVAADEEINIPPETGEDPEQKAEYIADAVNKIKSIAKAQEIPASSQPVKYQPAQFEAEYENRERVKAVEERIENLQHMIGEKMLQDEKARIPEKKDIQNQANVRFVKMIYNIMIENEVSEKYANQILDELDSIMYSSSSVDLILSNLYQKMVLKFGQSPVINLDGKKPKVVFFIGPTGVGKTTTIAKFASKLKVDQNKKVAFLAADTYRIAAAEQLRTYANILDAPLTIIYEKEELNSAIENLFDYDVVIVDTAGFSHKSTKQKEEIKDLIDALNPGYDSTVYLILSATTKYKDLQEIADLYKEIADYKMIFTKLDETSHYGNLLNLRLYTGAEIAYTTNGQNVPDDIEKFNSQYIVKRLLGGK